MMRLCLALLFLLVLAIPSSVHALEACSCEHFDKIKQEIENAVKLRERHRAKAAELKAKETPGGTNERLHREYSEWEGNMTTGAGAGIVPTVAAGPPAISYMTRGTRTVMTMEGWTSPVTRDGYTVNRYDARKAHAIEEKFRKEGKDLCAFDDEAAVRQAAEQTAPCKEIADINEQHEQSHRNTCNGMGFFAFFDRQPSEMAMDEVKAYDGQVAALQKLLGRSLKGAEVQFENKSRMKVDGRNFSATYVVQNGPAKAAIPDHEDGRWSVTLNTTNTVRGENIRIMGKSCALSVTSRSTELKVESDDTTARIIPGKAGPVKASVSCPKGHGSGGAGAEQGSGTVELPFKVQSVLVEDLSKGRMAAVMRGVATLSGESETKLDILCPAKK